MFVIAQWIINMWEWDLTQYIKGWSDFKDRLFNFNITACKIAVFAIRTIVESIRFTDFASHYKTDFLKKALWIRCILSLLKNLCKSCYCSSSTIASKSIKLQYWARCREEYNIFTCLGMYEKCISKSLVNIKILTGTWMCRKQCQ